MSSDIPPIPHLKWFRFRVKKTSSVGTILTIYSFSIFQRAELDGPASRMYKILEFSHSKTARIGTFLWTKIIFFILYPIFLNLPQKRQGPF